MALLEVCSLHGRDLVQLDVDRLVVGKSKDDAGLVIEGDNSVSRVHAVLERVGSRWVIRDVGSTNGTLVNGERIYADHVLRDDDEIILGRTRLRFYDRQSTGDASTERTGAAPKLTPKEREVLIELCRPRLKGATFTPPASVREIAAKLFVGEAAVKQHLGHLYDKFGIFDDEADLPRRVRLANAALDTGAVKLSDLKDDDPPPSD
jgi:pSer/pThr/pTyr-binding forkhead associated (FHA) protein